MIKGNPSSRQVIMCALCTLTEGWNDAVVSFLYSLLFLLLQVCFIKVVSGDCSALLHVLKALRLFPTDIVRKDK